VVFAAFALVSELWAAAVRRPAVVAEVLAAFVAAFAVDISLATNADSPQSCSPDAPRLIAANRLRSPKLKEPVLLQKTAQAL
jgi:hypothetical protein